MRSEQELKEVGAKLAKLTEFISEFGKRDEYETKSFDYACNVQDTILWVLEEITTEQFTSDGFLDVAVLSSNATNIEIRTGQVCESHESSGS